MPRCSGGTKQQAYDYSGIQRVDPNSQQHHVSRATSE